MALTQGSLVSWADIRDLYDKVNAERHRLLNEAVANRAASPTQGSIVYATTPANLRTLTAGAISGNTFAQTDLASTLTSINSLGNPAVGDLLTANNLSSLSGHLDTIKAYNPRITTGTLFTNFNATFHSAFTAANVGFAPGTFYGAFGTGCGSFHTSFGGCTSRFFGSHVITFCGGFSESGGCFCRSSFTYSTRFGSTKKFNSFHGTFSTRHNGFVATFFGSFGSANVGYAQGTFYAQFGSQAVTAYASYCSTFNSSFCPAEFCTSFNAASFFNSL